MKPAKRPDNHALEFHDSHIESFRQLGSDLEISLAGYLHCIEGNRTSGWSQPVIMKFANGSVVSAPSEFPAWINDADLAIADRVLNDLLELPFHVNTSVRFFGVTNRGEKFDFIGDSISVNAHGEATYVEEVRF